MQFIRIGIEGNDGEIWANVDKIRSFNKVVWNEEVHYHLWLVGNEDGINISEEEYNKLRVLAISREM